MTRSRILCVVMIMSFLVFCFVNFTKSLTPYVTFAEARSIRGSVQVKGILERYGAVPSQNEGGSLILYIRDDAGETHQVVYQGSLPDGFERAESLVVIGKYRGDTFVATKILTKCPSKYQEKGE